MSNIERSMAQDESLRWLARLDGEESQAEREAFERWRAEPENALALAEGRQLWQELRGLATRPDMRALLSEARAKPATRERQFFRSRWNSALAASVAICVLAAGAFLIGQHYVPTQTYTTGAGQRSTVKLDDGSQVILNVGTQLDVRYGRNKRQLILRSGEALFAVAQDLRRPFTVEAGDGEVTALGTRFQVRHESRRVTVTLLEGRVSLGRERMESPIQLHPGEQVNFSPQQPGLSRRMVDPEVASSWTTGRLKFRATPLAEVLAEVNRYTTPKIRVQDASLGQTPVNGVFEMGDSALVVAGLQALLPIEILMQDADEIVLTRK